MAATTGYLIGSIPTAGFIARLRGIDLRRQGSGNPGTNNALRTGGVILAISVLVVEAAKGYAAVLVANSMVDDWGAVVGGVAAVAGNVFNVWYGFSGGKGLGISLGVLLAPLAMGGAASRPAHRARRSPDPFRRPGRPDGDGRPARRRARLADTWLVYWWPRRERCRIGLPIHRDDRSDGMEALARLTAQSSLAFRTENTSVTGPSLIRSISIAAPNTPLPVGMPT